MPREPASEDGLASEYDVHFSLDPLYDLQRPLETRILAERQHHRRRKHAPPRIPDYEILGELGRGGMGVVYKARQISLNRIVALKMILAGTHATTTERERFHREAEAVARLQHPGIVQIFAIGEHEGQPYLVLEFVDGGSLAQALARGTHWPALAAAEQVEHVAEAMQYAHAQGVIHRDLKPANILLTGGKNDTGSTLDPSDSGPGPATSASSSSRSRSDTRLKFEGAHSTKISDFGLAKRVDANLANKSATRTGAVMGTPSYISPEQAAGKSAPITPAADVYSLGAILYELLTGRPPFKGDTPVDTILQVINDDPVPPTQLRAKLPRDLETICLKCLNKDPARRYSTAIELADDLRRFRNGEPIFARPVSHVARAVKWARRHPAVSAFGLTAGAALVTVVIILSIAVVRIHDARTALVVEATTAREQKLEADRERQRADDLLTNTQKLNQQISTALQDAKTSAKNLSQQAEVNQRSLYALQLAQAASICERDPRRALEMLNDPSRCPPALRDFAWRHLRRICIREQGQPYGEHSDVVLATAVSHDGRLVATADRRGQVRLWTPQNKTTIAVLSGHKGAVNGVAFSCDGRLIATTGDDGQVMLWELTSPLMTILREAERLLTDLPFRIGSNLGVVTLRPLLTIPAFRDRGRCIAFGPDGHSLAAGGSDNPSARGLGQADGVARMWDLNGMEVSESTAAVAGVALAAGKFVAARTGTALHYRETRVILDHLRPVVSVAFSADGRWLATASEDKSVQLNPLIGTARATVVTINRDMGSAVAFSPDSRTLATLNNDSDPSVQLWDVTNRIPKERARLSGHTRTIFGVAFSPDGQTVATTGSDMTVRLWDAETGLERTRLYGHRDTVRGVAFLPERRLVSISSDRTARVWTTSPQPSDNHTLSSDHPLAISTAAFSFSGRVLATGELGGHIRLWQVDAVSTRLPAGQRVPPAWFPVAQIAATTSGTGVIRSLAISDDGRYVAACGDDGLMFWDTLGSDPGGAASRKKHLIQGRSVYAVALSPDGSTIAAADAHGVWLWDARTGKKRADKPLVTDTGVRDLIFSPAEGRNWSTQLLAIGIDRNIKLFDLASGASTLMPHAHEGRIQCIVFGPKHHVDDGAYCSLATAGEDGGIRLWDLNTRNQTIRATPRLLMSGHTDAVNDLAFSHDGKSLVSGGQDRVVIVWDPVTGQERVQFTGHTDRVLRLGFMQRDAGLLSIGRDGTIKRWRAEPAFFFPKGPGLPRLGG